MTKSICLLTLFAFITCSALASHQCDYFLNSSELEEEIFEAENNDLGYDIFQIQRDKTDQEGFIDLLDQIKRLGDPDDLNFDESVIVEDEIVTLLEAAANSTFTDLIENTGLDNEEDNQKSTDIWLQRRISDLMVRTLTAREERIIRLRFFSNLDLEEIAKLLRLTRERIRQIEFTALLKLSRKLTVEFHIIKLQMGKKDRIKVMRIFKFERFK